MEEKKLAELLGQLIDIFIDNIEETEKKISILMVWCIVMLSLIFGAVIYNNTLLTRQIQDQKPVRVSDKPTAGSVKYLAELERSCMEAAPRITTQEEQVDTVSAYESEESDIPETEEEVGEDDGKLHENVKAEKEVDENERAMSESESDRANGLEVYFGYVPDDAELALWEAVVMAECGNTEPDEGIRAVADVVSNRVRSGRFPDTITGVIYQKNQFETVSNGAIWRYEPTDRVIDICNEAITQGPHYDYLFFTAGGYNQYCEPGGVIGNHYFGY